MADATQYIFSHKDAVTALIKHQGLTEGIWQLAVSFGFGVANIGEGPNNLNPTAVIPVVGVGIQRVTVENNMTVDATTVVTPP